MYRCIDVTPGDTNLHQLYALMTAYDTARSRSTNQSSFAEVRIYFDDSDATGVLYFCDNKATGTPPNFYGNKIGVGDQTVLRPTKDILGLQEVYVACSTATGRLHIELIGA